MKAMRIFFVALCFAFVPLAIAFGQFKTTNGGGDWNSTATWEGGVVPTGTGTIEIAAGDSVIYNIPVTISGTLVKNSTKKDSLAVSGSITFANGSTYFHYVNGGSIPPATSWGIGSYCYLMGVTSTVPTNSSQNFYNFEWYGSSAQTGNLNLGWHDITIGGNVFFRGTMPASSKQMRLTNNTFGTNYAAPIDTFNVITINGNFTLGDTADVTATGSGTPMHGVRVIVGGNLDCSSGTPTSAMFQLGNGSGAAASWWIQGHVILAACTLNTNGTYPDTLVFCGNGNTQQLANTGIDMNRWKVAVRHGANFYMPSGRTLGAATGNNATVFILDDGATFNCGGDSLRGNISVIVPDSAHLSKAANYSFVGSAAQSTSTLMPDTVNDLTIDNVNGVLLSKPTTVNGILSLSNGVLDNCNSNVTVPTANIYYGQGSLACAPVGVDDIAQVVPKIFKLYRNFPNPFNPTTELRFTVPVTGLATLKVYNLLGQNVAALYNGIARAGEYISVVFNAASLPSGVYYARLQQNDKSMIQQMVLIK